MWRKRRTRRLEYGFKVRFLQELRRVPVRVKPEALAWVRHWHRWPGRVLWEVTPTGEWRRL